jgi:hypothetical protein
MECSLTMRKLAAYIRSLHPLLPGRRTALALVLVIALATILLVGVVAAVEAAGGGAEYAVMTGIVAGDTADHGALEAALGVGRRGRGGQDKCGGGQCDQGFHDAISRRLKGTRITNRRRRSRFHYFDGATTSAILWSDGFTINTLACVMA